MHLWHFSSSRKYAAEVVLRATGKHKQKVILYSIA